MLLSCRPHRLSRESSGPGAALPMGNVAEESNEREARPDGNNKDIPE
jgi:hypothetical protein